MLSLRRSGDREGVSHGAVPGWREASGVEAVRPPIDGIEPPVPSPAPALEVLSLPKDKIRILLLEGVNDSAVAIMKAAGYSSVERLPKALDGDALLEAVKGVHIIGIRSRTQITAEVLEAADRLIAVGCFNVGTNQVEIGRAHV